MNHTRINYKYNRNLEADLLELTFDDLFDLSGVSSILSPVSLRNIREISGNTSHSITVELETREVAMTVCVLFEEKAIDILHLENKIAKENRNFGSSGLAVTIMSGLIEACKKHGFNKIYCLALRSEKGTNKFQGYTICARLGFVLHNMHTSAVQFKKYRDFNFRDWCIVHNRREKSFENLVNSKAGFNCWKKNGRTWRGVFYLDNKYCRDKFEEFLERYAK